MPLPGPFRISGRVGGHRNPQGGPIITLLAYAIVAVVVIVYGLVWLLVAAGTGLWHLARKTRTSRRGV